MATPQGYQCEFMEHVFDDFYCKKCTLVARNLTITTCCAESFCQDCIADISDQCPACGEKEFSAFQHAKNQRRIKCLQVYCIMKERGCKWSGTLEQLDTHLNPDNDNCQYVDTKCPLNCQQIIPKKWMQQHVAEECVKRDYLCKYCCFKATYEVVMGSHLLECKYVPLRCPNVCGVTCERGFMEYHMKTCRLEKAVCDFSGVGCDDQFRREDQEEHAKENCQKHLVLTASLAVAMNKQLQKILEQNITLKEEVLKMEMKLEELQKKLQNQDKIHKEEELKLKQKLEEQGKKLRDQDDLLKEEKKLNGELEEQKKKLIELEKKVEEQKKKLQDQENLHIEEDEKMKQRLDEQKQILEEQFNSKLLGLKKVLLDLQTKSIQNDSRLSQVTNVLSLRNFEMKNFSEEKAKDKNDDWKSPAMFTDMCGYKFYIGVDANGFGSGHGKAILLEVWVMPGEYDDVLKWPAKAKFTVELINQQGGRNASGTSDKITWSQPRTITKQCWICRDECNRFGFVNHSQLENFLFNGTLYFNVSNIELM